MAECAVCGSPEAGLYPVLPLHMARWVPHSGHARTRAGTFLRQADHPDRGWPNQIALCPKCDGRLRATYLLAEGLHHPRRPDARSVPHSAEVIDFPSAARRSGG